MPPTHARFEGTGDPNVMLGKLVVFVQVVVGLSILLLAVVGAGCLALMFSNGVEDAKRLIWTVGILAAALGLGWIRWGEPVATGDTTAANLTIDRQGFTILGKYCFIPLLSARICTFLINEGFFNFLTHVR